ncbi:futalosine hydrolase [Candidatus Omnitrophus magneticus]|uniref:Futalosine hydrolase n=1 Tax=Candidatus Omnitrophus magneticus TaxID=1609969 RepID=A0A0F0CMR2_9BACT|nr:futalosine hydrolase [Candidatus Omnitrophus magneticus]
MRNGIIRGTMFDDITVLLVETGMGKVNGAHGATKVLLTAKDSPPDMIINLGIGGAYPQMGLDKGDVAISSKEVYGDEGVFTSEGDFLGVEEIGIPLCEKDGRPYYNEFLMDSKLTEKALYIISNNAPPGIKVKRGVFVTVSTCTGANARAVELRDRYNGLCENMEGAAIAHICAMYGIPMIEVRGISNIVRDRDKKDCNINLAAKNCQEVVITLLENLKP